MPGTPYTTEFTVRFSETDRSGQLKPEALINYLEETALRQSESAGVGLDYYRKNSVIWLLHRFDISIDIMPGYGDRIVITTLPESVCKFFGYRSFTISLGDASDKDSSIIRAFSVWLFVDTRTKRPLRVSSDMKEAYGYTGLKEEKIPVDEIPAPGDIFDEKGFEVRHSDIDINRHVNNVIYINWAMEGLQDITLKPLSLKRLQVAWMKETLAGSEIILRTGQMETKDGVRYLQSISGKEGQEKCRIATTWEKG